MSLFRARPRRTLRALAALAAAVPLVLASGAPADAHTRADALRHRRFPHPLRITNRLFPLRPGTQFVYDGTVVDADGRHRHRVVFTVTDLVKVVNGVRSRVVVDLDYTDGELAEAELAFFAQDRHGNVLTMGEYPEEYEDGRFAGAPSVWVDGQQGAHAGVLVPGHPVVGRRFVQGRAPAVDFYDVGVVVRRHARTCVPVGCFRNVVVVEESSPLAPEDGKQVKDYAPGRGLVRVGAIGGDSREVMTLTRVRHLGPRSLAAVRAMARRLEARAYRVNRAYRHTPPMVRVARRHDD